MAESITIARPYACAVFKLANEDKRLSEWSSMLATLASVVKESEVITILNNPKYSSDKLASFIIDICGKILNQQGKNFVQVLAENGRLSLAAEVSALFEQQKADAEKTIAAEMISAVKVDAKQKAAITEALKNRLGCKIELSVRIDESILGGAIIRAGDIVIDGSVSGQLDRLASVLAH